MVLKICKSENYDVVKVLERKSVYFLHFVSCVNIFIPLDIFNTLSSIFKLLNNKMRDALSFLVNLLRLYHFSFFVTLINFTSFLSFVSKRVDVCLYGYMNVNSILSNPSVHI